MSHLYILVDGEPVPCDSVEDWAIWMESSERQLARDETEECFVSTVFLGTNHSFFGGLPILWETMIFGGEHDQWQERAHTKEEALVVHSKACKLAGITEKKR